MLQFNGKQFGKSKRFAAEKIADFIILLAIGAIHLV